MAKKKKQIDDRFKKFGTVSFTATTKINDFIEFLEKGKVVGTKCKHCGKMFFPPRADCYICLESDIEWFEVSGSGKLITYSTLQYAPVGFEGDLPYTIALVDYGEYKVFGRLSKQLTDSDVKVGMDLTTQAVTLPNGQLSYEFVTP